MKLRTSASILLGLSLAAAAQAADVTNTVIDINMDTGSYSYSGAYNYNWGFENVGGFPGTFQSYYSDYEAPDYTNAWYIFSFDNTQLEPYITNGFGGGYGMGLYSGPAWDLDTTELTGTNLVDYIVEFEARCEGLKEGVTGGNGQFQVRFEVPDDFFQPPDGNGDRDVLVQINYNFSVSSNWTHYVYLFSQGEIDGNGTWAKFVANKALANGLHVGCNFHQPDPQFGFDADNMVYFDNIKIFAVDRAPVPPLPKVPTTILDWNMDDKPAWFGWAAGTNGGWAANEFKPIYLLEHDTVGTGVNGSDAVQFWLINDIYEAVISTNGTVPNWAGGNAGFGGPMDMTQIKSGNPADYRLSMDARVEGLNPDAIEADFDYQIRFNAPDPLGTLVRLDYKFQELGSNWTHVSITLDKAKVGEGSLAALAQHFAEVDELDQQIQFNNVVNTNMWQFDADNKLFLDNFKLERLDTGNPPLTITVEGANVVVTWPQPSSGTCKLQGTSTPENPASWTDIAGATNPYQSPVSGAPKYFRTLWVPPF